MSYILDALRRAEAERERGAVPGLHAQTVPPAAMPAADRPGPRPWLWLASGVGIALLGGVVWTIVGRDEAPVTVTTPAAPPAPPPVAALSPAPPALPAPMIATAPSPSPSPSPSPPPISAQRSFPPAPPSTAPVVQTLPEPKPATPPPAPSPPVEPRVYALDELPADVKSQLPPLGVGGSIYSPDAASRVLILNGLLFHEKDKVGKDTTLLQIQAKSALLQFRDYRFRIAF